MADPEDIDDDAEEAEFDPYTPFSIFDWGSWKNYVAGALWNIAQIPRLIGSVISLAAVLMTFVLFNIDNFAEYLSRMPVFLQNAMRIISRLLNAGTVAMNWSLPGWAIDYIRWLNTFLPMTEVFQGISGVIGIWGICFVIRAILKFTILFR